MPFEQPIEIQPLPVAGLDQSRQLWRTSILGLIIPTTNPQIRAIHAVWSGSWPSALCSTYIANLVLPRSQTAASRLQSLHFIRL